MIDGGSQWVILLKVFLPVVKPTLAAVTLFTICLLYTSLKSGNYSAAEVADAVGFSDYNHFGRLFRRYYQCTPMEAVRESEGKSAKRPGRSEGIKTFEIGSIKKEDPVDVKSEKEKKK